MVLWLARCIQNHNVAGQNPIRKKLSEGIAKPKSVLTADLCTLRDFQGIYLTTYALQELLDRVCTLRDLSVMAQLIYSIKILHQIFCKSQRKLKRASVFFSNLKLLSESKKKFNVAFDSIFKKFPSNINKEKKELEANLSKKLLRSYEKLLH